MIDLAEYHAYLLCLETDVELTYGRMTLCDLRHYNTRVFHNKPYQLYCDDQNIKHFECYESKERAVSKFLELKGKIKSKVRNWYVEPINRKTM